MDKFDLDEAILLAQVEAFHANLPGIIIAPALGAAFSVIVLLDAVNTAYLWSGLAIIVAISAARSITLVLFQNAEAESRRKFIWRFSAVAGSLLSGLVWGSAAFFIYPPDDPEYARFLVILFSLTPIAPVAALASYSPTFYAYYFPASLSFVLRLVAEGDREALSAAVLLTILMVATVTFARKFHTSQFDAHRLRILSERQRSEIEALLREKRQFMLDAGHDLRQPVQALDLLLHSLRRGSSEVSRSRTVDAMDEAIENISDYLEKMQAVAALEATFSPSPVRFELDPILCRLHQEFSPLAEAKGLTLRYVPTACVVLADTTLLKNILQNLISNAIQHTRAGGVVMGIKRVAGHLHLQVTDTGPGISGDDQERIFGDFVRLGDAVHNHPEGLGLGLSIARRSAALMGLQINVASIAGKGTSFSVPLELARDAQEQPDLRSLES